jgi:hypothetical protein
MYGQYLYFVYPVCEIYLNQLEKAERRLTLTVTGMVGITIVIKSDSTSCYP